MLFPSRTAAAAAGAPAGRVRSLHLRPSPPPPPLRPRPRLCRCYGSPPRPKKQNQPQQQQQPVPAKPPNHRWLGREQELFILSRHSPGSPIFLPAGVRVFDRLVGLMRRQYVSHGFDEVITPTLYKTGLWEQSGHLQNYADDMYGVTEGVGRTSSAQCGWQQQQQQERVEEKEKKYIQDEEETRKWREEEGPEDEPGEDDGGLSGGGQFALKPMNCPGHCLIFASAQRSYRDLPIRYADFGALHRNEVSGALSGLTRVRCFHQDDGHIFCRPSQVRAEIARELSLIRHVYGILGLEYRLALSTRPAGAGAGPEGGGGSSSSGSLGSAPEWERAEGALREALEAAAAPWSVQEGEGAFYGPKIDVVVRDRIGREHQTATIQLDLQLPRRFKLEYITPAPERETSDRTIDDPVQLATYGRATPVLIHRAVLGSVERLMALLLEHHAGRWPFWLNPRQIMIAPVTTDGPVLAWARALRDLFVGREPLLEAIPEEEKGGGEPVAPQGGGGEEWERAESVAMAAQALGLAVDMDERAKTVGSKVWDARRQGYAVVLVVGEKEVADRMVQWEGRRLSPLAFLWIARRAVYTYAKELSLPPVTPS